MANHSSRHIRPPVPVAEIENECLAIVLPEAEALGLLVWHLMFHRTAAGWVLEITIDKPGGVTVGDCVALTNAINPLLDEADPIPQAYHLEVQSPGIERRLYTLEHFALCEGLPVTLRLHGEGYNRYTVGLCRIVEVDVEAGEVVFEVLDEEEPRTLRVAPQDIVTAFLQNDAPEVDAYHLACDESELEWTNIKPKGKVGRPRKQAAAKETEEQTT